MPGAPPQRDRELSAQLSLKVENKVAELQYIHEAIEEFGRQEEWDARLAFRVQLVIEEMVINVINYGHEDGSHEIEITMDSEPELLRIEITDDGKPFDPLEDAPEPDLEGSIEDRRVGGLGVYLVRTMMDDLSYQREQGKNHLVLVARRTE